MNRRELSRKLWLEALATLVVLEVVFFPLTAIFYLYSRPVSIGSVAAIALYSCLRPIICRMAVFRWIVLALGSPFYLLNFIVQSMMIRLSWLTGQRESIALAVVSAAFIVCRWRWPQRVWPLALLLLSMGVFAVQLPWPILALYLLGCAALLLAAYKGAARRLALPLLSLFAFLGLVLANDLRFYLAPDLGAAKRIESQAWARPLMLYGRGSQNLEDLLGTHLRFAIFSCDGEHLLLGSRTLFERNSRLVKLPIDGQGAAESIELAGTAGDNLERDCAAGRYLMPDQGLDRLELIGDDPFQRLESLQMIQGRLGLVRYSPQHSLALVLSDSHRAIFAYGVDPLARLGPAADDPGQRPQHRFRDQPVARRDLPRQQLRCAQRVRPRKL
ncbi:MAG: hypothetical protein P9M14_16055 [Candidatus Alcyoniella australis]|nr:hypothetical protein [Candidatus Alcyoniella australis]